MLEQLNIRAFKSLREFTIKPERLNLLIGANGTGKSNFADLIAEAPSDVLAAIEQNMGRIERSFKVLDEPRLGFAKNPH